MPITCGQAQAHMATGFDSPLNPPEAELPTPAGPNSAGGCPLHFTMFPVRAGQGQFGGGFAPLRGHFGPASGGASPGRCVPKYYGLV